MVKDDQERITSAEQLLERIIREVSQNYQAQLEIISETKTDYYKHLLISEGHPKKFLGLVTLRKDILRLIEESSPTEKDYLSYLEVHLVNIKGEAVNRVKDLVAKYVRDNHIIHWVIT